MISHSLRALAGASLIALLHPAAQASCGSAFCSIDSDWGGATTGLDPGSTLDLRYESIPQDQPRSGTRRVAVGEVPHHHDEVRTRNRNLVGTYTRMLDNGWGWSVTVPMVERDHLHIHNHHGVQVPEQWTFREVGDVRVTARYQQALGGTDSAPRTGGVFFGLKLPTGRTGVANADGDVAERSLQPGTGTTDLVLGAFFHQQVAASGAAWFAQAQLQRPLDSHRDFRPGARAGADVGYSHPVTQRLSGLVQLNAVWKGRDGGAQGEPDLSGGRHVFLSPGVSYKAGDAWLLYSYYQHPLRQDVNGVQLTARRAVVVGVSTRF